MIDAEANTIIIQLRKDISLHNVYEVLMEDWDDENFGKIFEGNINIAGDAGYKDALFFAGDENFATCMIYFKVSARNPYLLLTSVGKEYYKDHKSFEYRRLSKHIDKLNKSLSKSIMKDYRKVDCYPTVAFPYIVNEISLSLKLNRLYGGVIDKNKL